MSVVTKVKKMISLIKLRFTASQICKFDRKSRAVYIDCFTSVTNDLQCLHTFVLLYYSAPVIQI